MATDPSTFLSLRLHQTSTQCAPRLPAAGPTSPRTTWGGVTMSHHTSKAASQPAELASSGRVDVHAHCVPPEFYAVPAASAPLFRGFTNWNVPSALEMMDRQG